MNKDQKSSIEKHVIPIIIAAFLIYIGYYRFFG